MNIRIPYIMNPIHEGKYSTTIITKNGKTKKKLIYVIEALPSDQ